YNVETDASGAIQKNQDGLNILSGQVSDLRISSDTISAPRQTESITMKGNLNSGMPQGNERRTSINVYDANGGMHSLTFVFTRNANQNEFDLAAEIDGNQVALSSDVVQFNNDGTLNTPLDVTVTAADLNTAVGNQIFDEGTPKDISIQLGDPDNLVSGSLTNFSGLNTATASNQDGYQSGELIDISVDPQGKLWGAFTNGQSELLGQTVIAKFTNNDGLVREGSNFYSASPNSGLANIGTAGEIFPSTKIAGQSLEMSNVDMTTQFVDMISTQRAFEAASRTITLSDQLLAETNQLKR
ncbi:MAG: flagellar hook-basal body complex protein, partial [Bacteroidota bacterium]